MVESGFDEYADDYDAALGQGLAVSGEGRDFFAQGRLEFLRDCLRDLSVVPKKVMDFGCGTGDSVPLIRDLLAPQIIVGVDESKRSIDRAARTLGGADASFAVTKQHTPAANFDLVYTNGVFHHIPVTERPSALAYIRDSLRPDGLFALWENNPWSLPARYVMSKIPFDRDAVMMSATEARKLLRRQGFRVIRTDYLFIFPRALRLLRPAENLLRRIPAGAQYQVLCSKA